MSDGSGSSDNALGWVILLAFIAGAGYFVVGEYQAQLYDVARVIRQGEIWALLQVLGEDHELSWDGVDFTLGQLYEAASTKTGADFVGNEDVFWILVFAPMQLLKIPALVILGLLGFWSLYRGPQTHLRRKMDINGLIGAQSGVFPIIKPFVNFDPSSQPTRPPGAPVPAELPLFSEALGPEEWVAYNEIPSAQDGMSKAALYRAFTRQLGKPWRGYARLDPYKQIILAAFCLKSARKRAESDDMLGNLAACWMDNNTLKLPPALVKKARKVLKNRTIAGPVLQKCNQHAYENVALLRGLQVARENGGVLAPAQFVWLRGYDRLLWYPLNNMGRQSFHMEAIGAMAHFRSEKLTQRPIPRPKVDKAVDTIVEYMNSARARPVPALDYSKSKKKRGVKKVRGT